MGWQIAIDGPAAAGKSTIAKKVANILNFEYLDTGAMYRAATIKALELGIDLNDESKYDFILSTQIDFIDNKIYLDGKCVAKEIRSLEVSNNVSVVCKYKIVRDRMVELQRAMAGSKNIVMDGRDIGTVVLPNANLKIFLVASVEERARRRMQERIEQSLNSQTLEETIKEIYERDYKDSHREIAPLKKAIDAIEIDSSHLSIDEVINKITHLVTERGWNMENVKQVNETVVEEATKEEKVAETATVDANLQEAAPAENNTSVKELQLVEATVIEILDAEPEVKNKKGEVVKKAKDARVVLDLGNGQEGLLLKKEISGIQDDEDLYDEFVEGDKVKLVVKKVFPDGGRVLLSQSLVEKRENLNKYQEIIDNHGIFTAKVVKSIQVGLILDHEGYSCLLPTSQISMTEEEAKNAIDKEISVAPIRVDYNRIRLIVSQKVADAILERGKKEEFISKVKVGDIYEGTVKNIESYGAFVELENSVEGLLHISEIEHNRIVKVEKVLKTGDKVKVQVIKVENGHIGLSRKALLPNYWKDFIDATAVGQLVKGNVIEMNKAGVVIALNEHIQGFLPKSEISWERDAVIEDIYALNQEVELKVIELDVPKKRVILSQKQLSENPWEVLNLKAGDVVNCTVIGEIAEGVKLLVEGASGFLPKSNFGDKNTFAKQEKFEAKVRVFDAAKHKLIVSLKEEVKYERAPKKATDNELNKYLKNQEKVTGTFGDFINLDDYK